MTNHRVLESQNDPIKKKNNLVPIKDILKLRLESSFFEEGEEAIGIKDYYATRISENLIDIQVDFEHPELVTQSISEPDTLLIELVNGSIFMDKNDFQQLESTPELQISAQQ